MSGDSAEKCFTKKKELSRHPPTHCPECGSSKTWHDGLRLLPDGKKAQRYLCRSCGLRFSQTHRSSVKPEEVQRIETNSLKSRYALDTSRRVSETLTEGSKNLAAVETRNEKWAAGATADIKGKIVECLWFMKKQGYAESTTESYVRLLRTLTNRGANLEDCESVKTVIAQQDEWGKGRKWNAVKAFTLFLKMHGKTWEKPKYRTAEKLPFIPTEKEIDDLIAGCSKQLSTFLQTCKETGARRGEVFNLTRPDIDFETNTLRITPEKGSRPRIFKISLKLVRMLGNLKSTDARIWSYKNAISLEKTFRRQRKRIVHKLGNPRLLQIHCHTFRHWKASTEYAKTKDILYVQKLLGHRSLKSTLLYTQLLNLPHEEVYICKATKTISEAKDLIEEGFEYVSTIEETQLFRKRKVTFLGS